MTVRFPSRKKRPGIRSRIIRVAGSNPARGGIQLMTVRLFIAQNLSLSHFDMT